MSTHSRTDNEQVPETLAIPEKHITQNQFLQRILFQQQKHSENMDKMDRMVFSLDQKITSILSSSASATTSDPAPAPTVSYHQQSTCEPEIRPSQFFRGNPEHFGVLFFFASVKTRL